MKMTIKNLKSIIREALKESGEVDYSFISSEISNRLESEMDISQAVNSFLKDNPNANEGDVAKALKLHPIMGYDK